MSVTRPARLVPAPLPDFDPVFVVDVDVRDDLRAGREPLARILAAVGTLVDGSVLHLRTPFQPTPLFRVLADLGFEFHSKPFADDDWSSWFWRGVPAPRQPTRDAAPLTPDGTWDLRNLPPPEPLSRILDRIASTTAAFDVMLPAYPELLAGILADQGWDATLVAELADGVRVRVSPRRP